MGINYNFRHWEVGKAPRFECKKCLKRYFNKIDVLNHYDSCTQENIEEEKKEDGLCV